MPAARPEGQPPAGVHEMRREGGVLVCTACARRAERGRWAALAYSPCTAAGDGGPEPVRWRRVPHVVVERDGAACCDRCGGSVPLHRRHTFE
eukprot:1265463-Lingulodinium_polyedra.AAC.1